MAESLHVDLHAHTSHSHDAVTRPSDLVERAREVGLGRIAVTDHGTIEGALEARELDPELIVVGEEIRCRCRTELIGLFLNERIPMGLPLGEVVERIRAQNGLVYAPHPFAYAWRPLHRAARALGVADVVEGVNARAFLRPWNRAARRAARARSLPVAAGSDAHFPREIGRAWTVMPPFGTAEEFAAGLAEARPVHHVVSGPAYHLASMGVNAGRRIGEGWARLAARTPGESRRVARAS
ncbi:MAG: PHP-associated domain-containing protein [Gemmatimonadota bacterium]|nr:PHP-associated domain-containing protein [Gemmatimonadota bacterium]